MIKIPAHGATVKGLDVSHYDETIDFNLVKAAGFEFCWAKCTEGIGNRDPRYIENKRKAKAAGMLFGAYHFFRPQYDPKQQAIWFLAHASIEKGDFQPMFDWEVFNGPSDAAKAIIFLNTIEDKVGKKMIIYGPPYGLRDLSLGKAFRENPLCVAHYGTTAPLVPPPWSVWSFWQFSERGSVPGIPAPDEDLDLFNGTLENLKKFVI